MGEVAFSLLSIPATSASVERVFSQAGLCTEGRKNRIGPTLLEKKCLLIINDTILKR